MAEKLDLQTAERCAMAQDFSNDGSVLSNETVRSSVELPSLTAANNALLAEDYLLALSIYTTLVNITPSLANALQVNIALAKARLSQKTLGETLYKTRLAAHLASVSQTTQHLNVTVLYIISTETPVEQVIAQVTRLRETVHVVHVAAMCFGNAKVPNDLTRGNVDFAVIPIRFNSEQAGVQQLQQLINCVLPEVVFAEHAVYMTFLSDSQLSATMSIPLFLRCDEKYWFDSEYVGVTPLRDKLLQQLNNALVEDNAVSWLVPPFLRSRVESKLDTTVAGKVIVLFWKQNDTGLYGRRHDMAIKYLAERSDVSKVLVIDAPIAASVLYSKQVGHELTHDRDIYLHTYQKALGTAEGLKVNFNTFIYKSNAFLDAVAPSGCALTFDSYSSFLTTLFEQHNVDPRQAIFWFYPKNVFAEQLIDFFHPAKVVVDVVDDHRAWPGLPESEKEKLTSHYQALLSRADMAFANCQPVFESMREFFSNIALVPNGCDLKPNNDIPEEHPFYEELCHFSGPIIGFVGNLESKIDIILMEKVAAYFTDALIVLIGSTHANPAVRSLSKFSNIRLPGVIAYRYVNAFVAKFTVAIIPHLHTELTSNMNPLKAFVYLANAKPIVATSVPNLPVCDALIVVDSHSAFIDALIKVISGKSDLDIVSATRDFVKNNSWQARFASHVDLLMNSSC